MVLMSDECFYYAFPVMNHMEQGRVHIGFDVGTLGGSHQIDRNVIRALDPYGFNELCRTVKTNQGNRLSGSETCRRVNQLDYSEGKCNTRS